jgi:hypothetical protein
MNERVRETSIDGARRDKWYRSARHVCTVHGRQLRISLPPKRIRQISCVRFWCAILLFVSVFNSDSILVRTAAVIPFSGEA